MATGTTKIIPVAHLCVACKETCDEDNSLECTVCLASIHAHCLIKHGREKSTKKIQGNAPAWLHEVLNAAGIRYFCPTCLPSFCLPSSDDKPTATNDQSVRINDLTSKVTALDNKIDLLLSTMLDSSQSAEPGAPDTITSITKAKPSFAEIVAAHTVPTRDMLKDVVTEVMRTKDTKALQSTSVVFHGVRERNRSDVASVNEILDVMKCKCTITKTQRLGKRQSPAADGDVHAKTRPLLVTLVSESEQRSILQNAKCLNKSTFKDIYVRKWLTKEERDAENVLRKKCNEVNDKKGLLANGKKPFVVINGRVYRRRNDGLIDFKKAIDINVQLVTQQDSDSDTE